MLWKLNNSIMLFSSAIFVLVPIASSSAELTIKVMGAKQIGGMFGCGLFAKETGFPMDSTGAKMQWLENDPKGVICRFNDLADGDYAVSVLHDMNGNKKTDTNFLGVPTEAWGVSNNARPSFRPPRFDEAVFKIRDGKNLTIEIKVAK